MHSFTKNVYINKVLPHLLPNMAKQLGITQADKTAWKNLANDIKDHLSWKYDTKPEDDLLKDMSFNDKPIPKRPSDIQFECNDMLADMLNATAGQREWIKTARIEQLAKTTQIENNLADKLQAHSIEAFQKAPLIFSGKIFFTDILLPDYKIALEVSTKQKSFKNMTASCKTRIKSLTSHGYRVIQLYSSQIAKLRTFADIENIILNHSPLKRG